MDEACTVRGIERFPDLFGNVQNLLVRKVLFADSLAQSFPFDILHHNKSPPMCAANFVDSHDVRVIERGGSARLAFKARKLCFVLHEYLWQEFERHLSFEYLIQSEIDFTHSARTKPGENAIVSKLRVRSNLSAVYGELLRGQVERAAV